MKNFFTKIKYKFFLIFFRQKKKLLWTLVNNLMNGFISVPTISVLTLREDTSLGKKNEKIFVPNDSYQAWTIMNNREVHKSYAERVLEFTKSNISYNLIDIGANTGLLTRCLLNNLSNIKSIFLVEPDPDNIFCIKNNLHHVENINILDCALDLSDGEKKLFIDQNNKGNLSLIYEMMTLKQDKLSYMNSRNNFINVKTKNIKNYFNDIRNENSNIIKIDVQGYDEVIFQEIPKDVLIKTDVLFIEITPLKSKNFHEEKFNSNLDLFKRYMTLNGKKLRKNEVIELTKRQSGKDIDLIFLN